MSFGLRPYGVSPYGLVNTSAPAAYTLVVDAAAYTVTFADVGLRVGRKLVVDTAAYAVTFADVGLSYSGGAAGGEDYIVMARRRGRR